MEDWVVNWFPTPLAPVGFLGGTFLILLRFALVPYSKISRGDLVPASTLDRITQRHKDELDQAHRIAQTWREAWEASEEARTVQAERAESSEELGRVAVEILQGLRQEADDHGE